MSLDLEEWIASSNDAVEINLTRPLRDAAEPERVFSESFNPTFTYPIFGEAESIVGYKDPSIELLFRANDLKPSVQIQFEAKLELKGVLPEDQQVDWETNLKECLPATVTDPSAASEDTTSALDPTSKSWKPPGKLLNSFALHGKQYEVWSASLSDAAAMQIWKNMQILTLLFIEGASLPELDAEWSVERWTLYPLYEVTPVDEDCSPYTLAAFCTTYRYWIFPTPEVMRATKSLPSPPASSNGDASPNPSPKITQDPETLLFNEKINVLETPSRDRISQFIVLPPYQGQSLGGRLYDTIFGDLVEKGFIYEIPVEDPSEAFDAMRDYSDIVYLRKLPAFRSLSLPSSLLLEKLRKDAPIPRDEILGNGIDLKELRHQAKIVPRQFNRMVELHLLSTLPSSNRNKARITRKDKSSNENDRKYYFWRLALKDRIYQQNADVLEQLEDPMERVEKLEAAVDNQQEEYEERLEGIRKREKWGARDGKTNGAASGSKAKRKRKVVDEDEDDGWEDVDDAPAGGSKGSKKPRV
ncbi:histone acetyltransferase type B [Lentithecium fluviatile CBS 122367]|uniref:Histone acetyltransferase type B catalytic subunit n=1 Tax=Lentithecium fluviatile CBS 122367 TaxID=1168545 RepID=A0A6G1IEX9_9PLEO|nr:histone acetyltransferase type B [Lentithecium fluviatile CBS 122367]